jgi:hypothetical protein
MPEDYRSGQGTISPAMFIGIGGTGSRIVDRIAARASRLPNWESQLRPLTSFLSIDTNELDQHKLRHVPEGNRINIAAFDKARVIEHFRRSKESQALQWLDRAYQPRPGFKPGAGQIRVESRLGFFYHSPEIRQRLQQIVKESLRPGITWRQSSPPKYNAYVFCTLAGGTGSGAFLSVAYLIDAVIREQNWQPRVIGNLLLSTLMVDTVGPELHPDIHANTYAALKELEHLTKLDYQQVKQEGRTFELFAYWRDDNSREVTRVHSRPFFLAFLFDRPPHLGLPDAQAAIADAAYLQVFTPVIDNLAGELDNYEKTMEELTRFPGDLRDVGLGYTKNFGSFGATALVLPARDLLEYSALRFAAQAIRSQITFGVDPSDPADDRARALARLAVDYSDPKFLNLSDDGREREIHKAFVASVQEMARQDAQQELTEGFWFQLVDSIDRGLVTGTDEKGEPVRAESTLQRVERKLDEERRDLMNKVSIRERPFVFHKDSVNQYLGYVDNLKEDVRRARSVVDEGVRGLETSAFEGEAISVLKLDPIAERYLVLRLLELCETRSIPDAQKQLENERAKSLDNSKVRERLEKELYESLQEAASERRLFRRDQGFYDARNEAEAYYKGVASASRKTLDAEARLRQVRSLLEYLSRRSRQYARLANRMDALVQDLERDAERLRRGERAIEPGFALRVEVFETLDEPRERIWHRAYRALYLDGGRYLSTFDRQTLASAISQQLKPVVRADGSVAEKSVDTTVADLRRALTGLGRQRLAPALLGGDGSPGLDLASGLELEARLMLAPTKKPGEEITDDEIETYRDRKFRALEQLAGVLARVSSAESKALDDGVKLNRTRQLVIGLEGAGDGRATERFVGRLRSILEGSGRQVKLDDSWHDPRLAIVHDVEMPIPLYYVEPITGEIEDAYLRLADRERPSYNLHTDFHWEKSLPNLNPRRSEISVGWSLEMLARGLVTGVIDHEGGTWRWLVDGHGDVEILGDTLATALYRLGEIHRKESLQERLARGMERAAEALAAPDLERRRERLGAQIDELIAQIERREMHGDERRVDTLDRPVLKALKNQLASAAAAAAERRGDRGYQRLSLS